MTSRDAEVHGRLGITLLGQGRFAEAEAACRVAIAIDPADATAHNALGIALVRQGRVTDAIISFQQAVAARPDLAEAHSNLGYAQQMLGHYADAEAACRQAITLRPDHADAYNNLGNALKAQERLDDAVAAYRHAIALKPDLAEAHHNLPLVLTELGRADEAIDAYRRATAVPSCFAEARFGVCMAQLPILCADEAELARRHDVYARELMALVDDVAQLRGGVDFSDAVGAHQPFYLAYHGRNDRELQQRYGDLVCGIMAERYPTPRPTALAKPGEKIRVGIVSGFFVHHSVWKIPIRGWLHGLDRDRFRLFGYHTGTHADDVTATAAALCERFVHGARTITAWREAILQDAPHVLIYPEIGMDPVTAQLAAQRLAPVQCNAIGHPMTGGFTTIDYFLTSDLMEPADGAHQYTETLVRLPNLSVHYEPLEVPALPVTRPDLGLRPNATVYWSGQSLYKYLPQHDDVFARIATAVGDAQFVFIAHGKGTYVTDCFRQRLDRAFVAAGLNAADHCVVLPRLDIQRFLAVMGLCNVFLDSLGWSGFNTAMESLSQPLPIVTCPGATMRSQHSAGVLRAIGVTETIAATVDDYVAIAARLARDRPWRAQITNRMRTSRHRAWRDAAAIKGLEAWLERVVRGPPPPS
jgi:predicted O-linked N-acetylglucosamine transferase (SPINDLY family)